MPLALTGSADSIYTSVWSFCSRTTRTSLERWGWLRGCRAWGAVLGLLEGNTRHVSYSLGEPESPECGTPALHSLRAVCGLSPCLRDFEASLFLIPQPLASRSPWQADPGPCRGQRAGAGGGAWSPRPEGLLPRSCPLWLVRRGPSLRLTRTDSPKRSHSPRALPRALGDAAVTQPGAWGLMESQRGPRVLQAAVSSRVLEGARSRTNM